MTIRTPQSLTAVDITFYIIECILIGFLIGLIGLITLICLPCWLPLALIGLAVYYTTRDDR